MKTNAISNTRLSNLTNKKSNDISFSWNTYEIIHLKYILQYGW